MSRIDNSSGGEAEEQRLYNQTFRGYEKYGSLNACVGNNGAPGLPQYANGFLNASIKLCETVIDDDINNSVDDFIYPICFNLRHGLELWIKYFLSELDTLPPQGLMKPAVQDKNESQIQKSEMTKTHDINVFWSWFVYNCQRKDERFHTPNLKLQEYIRDIGQIDPTGQTFRYPYDTESRKHLVITPIINVFNLVKRIKDLSVRLGELDKLIGYLSEEYRTGTYTKKLSRAQLFNIASSLPKRSEWSSDEFANKRKKLMSEYNLGSRSFSKALDLIQGNYELASKIGLTLPLKSLKFEELKTFIESWAVFHPQFPTVDDHEISLFSPSKTHEERDALNNAVSKISKSSQADIGALFYLARSAKFSENYQDIFKEELLDINGRGEGTLVGDSYIYHFLIKTNFIPNLVRSLSLLRQKQLLDLIKNEFSFIEKEVARQCLR